MHFDAFDESDPLKAAQVELDPRPRQGERWADVFGQAIGACAARTRSGALCRLPGVGCGGRCRLHGGNSTGPKTPVGRMRSRLNGLRRANPRRENMDDKPTADQVPGAAPAAPPSANEAPRREPAPAAQPSRPTFLEQLLDQYLSGKRRWTLVDSIFRAVLAPVPRTRAELLAELPEPGTDRVIGMLLARGVLIERVAGRRVVIDASATARPAGIQAPRT